MKKRFTKLRFYCLLVLLSCLGFQAQAGHTLWSELTYNCVAPGIYAVNLKMYRDCGGPMAPGSYVLNLKSPGCNTGRSVNMNKNSTVKVGAPYCASVGNTCNFTQFNFEEHIYTATVTFTTAERACPDWVLSWEDCCRPATVNVNNAGDLYAEARLKLLPNLINNSPQFGAFYSPFVHKGQPVTLSNFATDQDGDSLVYSIQNPLTAYNTPLAYRTFNTEILYNHDSTQFGPLNWTFTNSWPIISYTIDWSTPMPNLPVRHFAFNSKTGSFNIIPSRFKPVNALSGDNRYALITQVDEYRKINGVPMKIGSVRRDIFVAVVDDMGNRIPELTTATANGQPVTETDVIQLRPGTGLNFQFATADSNQTDVVSITSDAADILPGAIFSQTGSSNPAGTITWIPTAAHVRDQIYYFHVLVSDNACPVKGFQTYTFGVKVSAGGGVTGAPESYKANAAFTVFPNPFTSQVNFNLPTAAKAESILIFNVLGQQVDQIFLQNQPAGEKNIPWKNAAKFTAGTYVARLVSADKTVQTQKFTKLP